MPMSPKATAPVSRRPSRPLPPHHGTHTPAAPVIVSDVQILAGQEFYMLPSENTV